MIWNFLSNSVIKLSNYKKAYMLKISPKTYIWAVKEMTRALTLNTKHGLKLYTVIRFNL